jgi:hypothetical protein
VREQLVRRDLRLSELDEPLLGRLHGYAIRPQQLRRLRDDVSAGSLVPWRALPLSDA